MKPNNALLMNINQLLVFFVLCLFLSSIALGQAQDNKESQMYFGAIAGLKVNDFNDHFALGIDPQINSFSIGAGSAWTRNNYIIGFEFVYSSGMRDNASGELQYIGFNNTLTFGYNLTNSSTWKIEPTLGVGLSNNQLIVENRSDGTFQNLENNQFSGSLGVNIKLIGQNGLFTGLRIGYMLPFGGDSEWENKVGGVGSGLQDNVGSALVQLNIGGLLDLKKQQE